MSNAESAFDKKLTPDTTLDKIEAVLEHLNLPPKALAFFRRNYRTIQVVLVILIASVISWSLYSSYVEKRIENSSAALSEAMEKSGPEKAANLEKVVSEFEGTASGLWARVELAHIDMQENRFSEAADRYRGVLAEVGEKSPLYPLVLFGLAQALEAGGEADQAVAEYDRLKDFVGYEAIGYQGMGRIEENRGNLDKAIAIYNNFLLSAGDNPSLSQASVSIQSRIAHLKARK